MMGLGFGVESMSNYQTKLILYILLYCYIVSITFREVTTLHFKYMLLLCCAPFCGNITR